ncbi:glycosyltransferase [Microseira sp. BLCC-F43]|jgi:hypothetical protein|uniref:glycosyltransferase n=1 Tax=Microseira sp. BLCC-F43 TaxID=3153602 RepID=UPI0035BA2030
MKKIKSLLITSKDVPADTYGTGQRLLSIKIALEKLGECRVLRLAPQPQENIPATVDYNAPSGIPHNPSRMYWIRRNLIFSDFRLYLPAIKEVEKIRETYQFDVAFCSFFAASVAAPHHFVPCILDADRMPMPETTLTRAIWPVTKYMMNRCGAKFKHVFVIRPDDRFILNKCNTTWLPCISASAKAQIDVQSDAKNILFVGSAGWQPNRDAITFLITQVLPRLRAINPELRIRLVGDGTEAYSGIDGVDAAGFVADIVEEYKQALVVMCPIWNKGGANVKLAEALQYGCAIVASTNAADGFRGIVTPGKDILVAENNEMMIEVLCNLIKNPVQLVKIKENARLLADSFLSQAYIDKIIKQIVSNVVEQQ